MNTPYIRKALENIDDLTTKIFRDVNTLLYENGDTKNTQAIIEHEIRRYMENVQGAFRCMDWEMKN